ncbi:hypothetical protein CEXT_42651 [Caerostris extrusa]|uniref:Uncharacterized protein n=1 Tax=Caerostris extrusa TaxID=172846 RepID=A0AAV4MVV2_CAEEX|nr:hypothetical protein CEXT_42651 [Caerostris extrusa]
MTALLDEIEHINSINGSHTTFRDFTTMPSYVNVRNPMGRMHPPHPRPTGYLHITSVNQILNSFDKREEPIFKTPKLFRRRNQKPQIIFHDKLSNIA